MPSVQEQERGKPPPEGVKKCYGKTVRVLGLRCGLKLHVHCQHGIPLPFDASMNKHRYTSEQSREIAPSAIALYLVTTEAAKGYGPAQVLNKLRGNGTSKGSTRLIEVEQCI